MFVSACAEAIVNDFDSVFARDWLIGAEPISSEVTPERHVISTPSRLTPMALDGLTER